MATSTNPSTINAIINDLCCKRAAAVNVAELFSTCRTHSNDIGTLTQDKFVWSSALSIQNSDHDLVVRTQNGDNRAFDLLVQKHQHKVMGVISRYIKDRAEIEDVAQETFIKAFRALKNFRGDSQFYTWLYRIATNTAKNHLVSRSRRPPSSDVDASEAEFMYGDSVLNQIENPENQMFGEELESLINATIKNLPEDLRQALSLREFEGLSYDEIAEVMECPIGTVRSRIFRAREAIDKLVKPIMERNEYSAV